MERRTVRASLALALTFAMGLALSAQGAQAAGPAGVHLQAVPGGGGLDNPRGIDVVNGAIVVAEAGKGGSVCKKSTDPGGGATVICAGMTGKITRISHGAQTTLGWFPSMAEKDGTGATGPADVSALGPNYRFEVLGYDGLSAPKFDSVGRLGHLLQTNGSGTSAIANLVAFEAAHDPDGGPIDSDPYSVAALGMHGGVLVADAAGNDLLRVNVKTGGAQVVATFPTQMLPLPGPPPVTPQAQAAPPRIPAEAVPTSVTVGPDGAWYVSELKGFPFTPGSSRIWRIEPGTRNAHCRVNGTGPCTLYAKGFTSVVSIDFGPDGALYISEIAKHGLLAAESGGSFAGALIRYKNGVSRVLVGQGLFAPGGVAVSSTGRIFIVNNSVLPGAGRVLEVVGA